MTAAREYLDVVGAAVARLADELDPIEEAAVAAAEAIAAGGVVHVAGSGHSQLVALEAFGRAGGLAAVAPLVDPALGPASGGQGSRLERLGGYAEALLAGADLRQGEVLVVVSHAGINAFPVELARGAVARGLTVVAVTSLEHGSVVPSRQPDDLKLHDVAHIVVDTGAPLGDAAVTLAGERRAGPLSTVLAEVAVHAILTRAAELVAERGHEPPLLTSRNIPGGIPGDADPNAALLARYRQRTGWLT